METTPFNKLYVRPTEHWERFIDYKDNIRATTHYIDRLSERSDISLWDAMVLVRDAIAKGKVKKSQKWCYLAINRWVHVIDLEEDEVVLVTYYKTERQARIEENKLTTKSYQVL